MDKINIAELLKDCPKGMELDCASYNNVSFDKISDNKKATYPIFCYITDEEGNRSGISFTENGCESKRYGAKCVIFPKGKTTWEGFVPPCPFKDGDIITDVNDSNPFIFHYDNGEFYDVHCALINDYFQRYTRKNNWVSNRREFRLATEEEKQKLFDAIKANGYKWNAETKTLELLPKFKVGNRIKKGEKTAIVERVYKNYYDIRFDIDGGIGAFTIDLQDEWELAPNKFDITTLKPFDKVLVRDGAGLWRPNLFGKDMIVGYRYFTANGSYKECIPYEGNEHLLGTTNDCDDFYKTWEK